MAAERNAGSIGIAPTGKGHNVVRLDAVGGGGAAVDGAASIGEREDPAAERGSLAA